MKSIINIVDIILEKAKQGNKIPIWTTCLGFEALVHKFSNFKLKQEYVNSLNHSLPMNINNNFKDEFKILFNK